MEINTVIRTRETSSSSRALQVTGGWRLAADIQGRGDNCALFVKPAADQGGAMTTVLGMAPVTAIVFDHTYSTRPGSTSCSPPV